VLLDAIHDTALMELQRTGAVLLDAADRARLQEFMWPDGKLAPSVTGQSVAAIAARAQLAATEAHSARALLVEESGFGPEHPFSGEKLSPVLAVYRARDFADAIGVVERIYAYMGAGHSVGLHTARTERAVEAGLRLPVSRVIVNQAHCIATGGSFDNGLPFSLSMGCGTWGRNNFSDNLNYRHYLNITRVSTTIPEVVPTDDDVLGEFFARHGRG
jgi:sulfoacetaldehyde dehydrogenase